MPKFKMERSYSLHNILPNMGMASLFSKAANLTKLSQDKGLMLSEVSLQFHHVITRSVHIIKCPAKGF